MKKFRNIVLLLLVAMMLASCASSGKSTFSAFADIPGYLTKNQKTMIRNIQRLDKEGYLYRLDYTEDYQLAQVVAQSATETGGNLALYVRNLMSPNSKYKTPTIGYNSACSAFSAKTQSGNIIHASNFDGANADTATVIVRTNPLDGYKSVGLVDMTYLGIVRSTFFSAKGQDYLLDVPFYTVSGINEKGLAVSALVVEHSKETFVDTSRPNLPSNLVVRCLLDYADSVDTAVKYVNRFDITPDADGTVRHYMLTDSSGAYAVIELIGGKISLIKPKNEGYSLTVANYYLSPNASEIKDGLWRKRLMDMNLAMTPALSEEGAMDILSSVKYSSDYEKVEFNREIGKNPYDRANLDKITVWSVVYNLNKMNATLALREKYDSFFTFGL